MDAPTIGNNNLISKDERRLADFLRERNLQKTNTNDEQVHFTETIYVKYIKRVFDLLIGVPVFALTLPFNIVFGVCTFIDVGCPIFYKQTRIGKNGVPFILVKFRNMSNKTDADGKLLPAKERVTKFGRFMRKYSLDELLNFWSVVKGDMSIIGPRPLPEFFAERMSERHKMRHAVKPGLECPRVYILKEENLCNYHRQFENDIWYVEHISFITDLKMCFKLIEMVFELKSRDRNANGNASSYFVGYDDTGHALSMNTAIQLYPLEAGDK